MRCEIGGWTKSWKGLLCFWKQIKNGIGDAKTYTLFGLEY